jgi:hypothetical protein|tara:strand:- start:324 stop:491 length:168 start_codon:yes stop_codon:yes gene_type:complete
MAKKETTKTKKTDKQIEINDIADLLVAVDNKVRELEKSLKEKDLEISKLKQRLGL